MGKLTLVSDTVIGGALEDFAVAEPHVRVFPDRDASTLCVDLDGTLVRTDTLFESIVILLRNRPWWIFLIPIWILRGKAFLKRRLGHLITLRVDDLPYHQDLLRLLRSEARNGRRLVLVSCADETIARRIANHLDLFDDVLASNGGNHLAGAAKTSAIRELLGAGKFIYAGDSRDDLDSWMNSEGAILVNAPESCATELQRHGKAVLRMATDRKADWRSIVKAVRLHQWTKNLLVFMVLLLSHKLLDVALLMRAGLAFAALSLAASSLYIVNDLLDLNADRLHPRKRFRPLASGELSIRSGLVLAAILAGLAALCAAFLPWTAGLLLALYCCASLMYSLYLKRLRFVDVILLASLFTLRILLGGAATGVEVSHFTLAFSMFLFFSLALTKRLAELRIAPPSSTMLAGRGYFAADFPLISVLGSTCSFLAVAVLALYLRSPEVHVLYSRPWVLWFLCPLIVYWLARCARLTNRGLIHDDPIVFAFTDRVSLIVGVLTVLVLLFAL